MSLLHAVQFLRRYVAHPTAVGSVAPSSRWLVEALTGPFAARTGPANLLEVGAGTGAVTRRLASLMGPDDRLDICEIDPTFLRILRRNVLTLEPLAVGRREGRVRLLRRPVQQIDAANRYDYVISSLPLSGFETEDVRAILETIQRNVRPGGVFSYFEYMGIRRLAPVVSISRRSRNRARAVCTLLDDRIRSHQFARRVVLFNIPPAFARHWRFSPNGRNGGPGDKPQSAH